MRSLRPPEEQPAAAPSGRPFYGVSDRCEGAPYERARDVELPRGSRERRRRIELVWTPEQPRNRCYPGKAESNLPTDTSGRDSDLGEGPALAVHRLQVDARLDLRQLDLEDQLAGLEGRRPPVGLVRQPVQVRHRQLAPRRPQRRPERDECRGDVGGMRRRAEVVREARVLAVLALPGMAALAAVATARVLEAPVPAPGLLQEVPAERAHVAELRRGREPARLAQRVGNRGLDLELGERRS